MAADSASGVSCWFIPSVSRMACFWLAPGTEAKTRAAMVSQVPIAVPPSARKEDTAALAAARVVSSIRTMPSSRAAAG